MKRFEYGAGGPNSVMDYGYYVYCTQCGAGTGVVDVPPPSEEEAATEWNRRAQPPVDSMAYDIVMAIRRLCDIAEEYSDLPQGYGYSDAEAVREWLKRALQEEDASNG